MHKHVSCSLLSVTTGFKPVLIQLTFFDLYVNTFDYFLNNTSTKRKQQARTTSMDFVE